MKFIFALSILISSAALSQTTKKACFLGNSYTGVNDLPGLISSIATADGNTLIKDQNTPGGTTLLSHSSNTTSLTKIASDNWDFVILQDQSQMPSFPYSQVQSDVYPYAEILCDSIRAANECAIPLFYNTWGRRDGDPQWDSINTFDKMNERLFNAYEFMADFNAGMRAPAGSGFDHVHNDLSAPITHADLYATDGSHPSIYGSFLTACIFYEIIFDEDVQGNTHLPSGITTPIAAYLQTTAHHVVHEVDSIEVDFTAPEANFSYTENMFEVSFINESIHDFEWLWDFGNGNTSNEENPTFDFGQSGDFEVTLTVYNCGQEDDTTFWIFLNTTGVEEQSKEFKVYPNPSNGDVSISAATEFDYQIFDIEGRLVKRGNGNKKADLHLETGLYFVEVDGVTQKLIIL